MKIRKIDDIINMIYLSMLNVQLTMPLSKEDPGRKKTPHSLGNQVQKLKTSTSYDFLRLKLFHCS